MAVDHPLGGIRDLPKPRRDPLTGRVARIDDDGWVYVSPLGGDLRSPIGPCRSGGELEEGDVVLLIFTQERPWALSG